SVGRRTGPGFQKKSSRLSNSNPRHRRRTVATRDFPEPGEPSTKMRRAWSRPVRSGSAAATSTRFLAPPEGRAALDEKQGGAGKDERRIDARVVRANTEV